MAEPTHRSIGEVLSLLKYDHPDITISKIRFLESQGLISPERTPSGYRKFYDPDVSRLRWILEQQRDNFLPLKVIKRRLDSGQVDTSEPPEIDHEPTLFSRRAEPDQAAKQDDGAAPEPPPTPSPEKTSPLIAGAGSVSMSIGELADASGTDVAFVEEILRLGLIATIEHVDAEVFDHEALIVAKAAATFNLRGVEPRHLRMFKVAAERQAGMFEQLLGSRSHRSSEAAAEARVELAELVGLGETIQRSVLRRNLGRQLRQP